MYFNRRCYRIFSRLIAADDADDISLFGVDAPERLSSYFSTTGHKGMEQAAQVRRDLENLLHDAADIVRPIMSATTRAKAMPCVPEKSNRHEPTFEYFTHVSVGCNMPWVGHEMLNKEYVPPRDYEEASKEWLGVVGLNLIVAGWESPGIRPRSRTW